MLLEDMADQQVGLGACVLASVCINGGVHVGRMSGEERGVHAAGGHGGPAGGACVYAGCVLRWHGGLAGGACVVGACAVGVLEVVTCQ